MRSRLNRAILPAVLLTAALSATAGAASPYDDAFTGMATGSQWTVFTDDANAIALSQSGGQHLSLVSAGGGVPTNDALYLSKFRLSTAADFSITLDYSIDATLLGFTGNGASGDRLGLVFGVGRDLPDGTDSAAIGVGIGNQSGFVANASTVSYRVNDITPAGLPTELLSPLTGTLAIDYLYASDSLTLSRIAKNGEPTFTYTLPAGTVRGRSRGTGRQAT